MSRDTRKRLIQQIEKKRKSKVITYVTSDRPNLSANIQEDAVPVLHEHILAIPEGKRKKLDLLIYSRGGDSNIPWSIISMFREYCREGSLGVLLPYKAHSAATIIALGADEIVMTRKAELGPIDITLTGGPYNPTEGNTPQRLPISVEDVTGFFSLLDKVGCERPEEKMRAFEQLCGKVHPLALGTVSRLLQQTELVALRMLGTRAEPFTEDRNRLIVRRLSSEIFSHRHTISRMEAVDYLGLSQVKKAEDEGIDAELWKLYEEYRDHLQLTQPFAPEQFLLKNRMEEHEWKDLEMACIESSSRVDYQRANVKVGVLRQPPPTINVNIGNIGFPPVNIPALPAGLNPAQLQQLVEQIVTNTVGASLNALVQQLLQQLIWSLPIAGFQKHSETYWKTEP